MKLSQSCSIANHRRSAEEKLRKTLKTPDLEVKPQVWHHWPNHFESTKKVTQIIEQIIVM